MMDGGDNVQGPSTLEDIIDGPHYADAVAEQRPLVEEGRGCRNWFATIKTGSPGADTTTECLRKSTYLVSIATWS